MRLHSLVNSFLLLNPMQMLFVGGDGGGVRFTVFMFVCLPITRTFCFFAGVSNKPCILTPFHVWACTANSISSDWILPMCGLFLNFAVHKCFKSSLHMAHNISVVEDIITFIAIILEIMSWYYWYFHR